MKSRLTLLCIAIVVFPTLTSGQEEAGNPFAGIETHVLSNGMKLWFKNMPQAANVAVSVVVPTGQDRDPEGKEQMAHFLEHMQFSDHLGRTTEEIKQEVDDRGGEWNGFTTTDRTFYFVHVGQEHGPFALEWMYRLISPHEMDPEVVDREREPVEIEVGARSRQFFDWIEALYLDPPALRPRGFWEREFGIETRWMRDYYAYRSVAAITPQDLLDFYDQYYDPRRMTLTVIGDLDREMVIQTTEATFGQLPTRSDAPAPIPFELREGRAERFFWTYRPTIAYSKRFRLQELTQDEEVTLLFISRLLGERLNDKLRFGERKAVYGIGSFLQKRGPVARFSITGNVDPEDRSYASEVIESELEMLRTGTLPDSEFEDGRATLVEQLRVSNATPEDLESWVWNNFYDPVQHTDFPDLVTRFEGFDQEDVAAFASRYFTSDREIYQTVSPFPLSQGLAAVLAAGLLLGSIALMRRALVRPLDMTRIRYVAHIRMPRVFKLFTGAIALAVLAVSVRLLVYVYMIVAESVVLGIGSFWIQWSVFSLMGVSLLVILVLALTRIPSKVLLFDDRILIKYRTYRSVEIPLNELEETTLEGFSSVWMTKKLWTCLPLKLGLLSPGVYLKRKKGRGYFFDVRDRNELLGLLQRPPENAPSPG